MTDETYLAQEIESALPDVDEARRERLLANLMQEVRAEHSRVVAIASLLTPSEEPTAQFWFICRDLSALDALLRNLTALAGVSVFRHDNQDIWHAIVPESQRAFFLRDMQTWECRFGREHGA